MHRWHWLPISFVTAGVLSMWGVAIVHAGALGWWQVLIYLGGIVALTAAFWFRRELSATEIELEGLRNDLAAEQARLDKRERALDERFRTYHEWMEFPQPIDLKEPSPAAGQDSPGEMIPRDRDLSDDQLQELAAQDRQLMELLQAQTNALYDNLLTKKYNPDGTFQPTILRDDAYELVRRVARIYQPNAEQPLAETNPALVIRAASRACLQFLVVLDELPLNVKDRSFNALYGYALNAVRAYRAYKSVEPDRKSTRLNSSHGKLSRMPSSA